LNLNVRGVSIKCLLLLSIALLAPASPAFADGTCARTDTTLDIEIEANSSLSFFVLSRDSGGQINLVESLLLGSNDIDCGDASVNNVDLINIQGSPSAEELAIRIGDGGFSPGATPEGNLSDSEIEIRVGLGKGQDFAAIQGTAEPETLRMGAKGANLNGDGDGNDIVFRSNVEFPGFFGNEGNDVLTASGGFNTGGPMKSPVFTTGGLGNDRLEGGSAGDSLLGQGGGDRLIGLDGNDNLGDVPLPSAFGNTSEDGNDRLFGGSGGDNLRGGSGRDLLKGGKGDDEEHGGDGPDSFKQDRRSNGADRIFGGDGTDDVDYSKRGRSVRTRLNNKTDDGQTNEGDSLGFKHDLEGILGGRAADRLIGNGEDNLLSGGRGPDFLNGKGGTDACTGDQGNDTVVNCE
jgi:hypothetical protein